MENETLELLKTNTIEDTKTDNYSNDDTTKSSGITIEHIIAKHDSFKKKDRDPNEEKPKKKFCYKDLSRKQKALLITAEYLFLFFVVFLAFKFLVGLSIVHGDSMYPTLKDSNIVFYTRYPQVYERGQIVVVDIDPENLYVKRVIAVEGDTVELRDGYVYLNGEKLEETYTAGDTYATTEDVSYPVTLGEGQYFVLGDNRENSKDSRNFGVITAAYIEGRLLYYAGTLF